MIGVNFSSDGYYLNVNDASERTRPLREKLVSTKDGMTFKNLASLPDFVIANQQLDKFTVSNTRSISPKERLGFLREYGFTIDVATGLIVQVSGLWQRVSAEMTSISCRGLPQPYSKHNGKTLTGAYGVVDSTGIFTGRFEYEIN